MNTQIYDDSNFDQVFISYIKKTLFFGSKEFYRSFKKNRDAEVLILDARITGKNDLNYIDTIMDPYSDVVKEVCNNSTDIRDYIENKKLLEAMNCLTDKELYILYKFFVEEKNGVEIGEELKVTKQYINKIKGQALKKLRNFLETTGEMV